MGCKVCEELARKRKEQMHKEFVEKIQKAVIDAINCENKTKTEKQP